MNRIPDTNTPHDPGTHDDDIPPMRLEGRIEWWLGWYDERFARFYSRHTKIAED